MERPTGRAADAASGPLHGRQRSEGRWAPIGFALAVGTVTWCLSEPIFWARLEGGGNDPAAALLTWSLYCAVARLALVAYTRFHVEGWAGLVLVGALVGWLVEGAAVAELAGGLPLSLAWTALGWHAAVTVLVGWWLLPALLRHGGPGAWVGCILGGIAWGAWSVDPLLDDDAPAASGAGYVALVIGVSAVLAVAYASAWRLRGVLTRIGWGTGAKAVAIAFAAWATAASFIPAPIGAPILVVLLAGVVWALRRLDTPTRTAVALDIGAPIRLLAPLAAFAGAAGGTNLALDAAGITLAVVEPAAIMLTLAGIVLLTAAVRAAVGSPRHSHSGRARRPG